MANARIATANKMPIEEGFEEVVVYCSSGALTPKTYHISYVPQEVEFRVIYEDEQGELRLDETRTETKLITKGYELRRLYENDPRLVRGSVIITGIVFEIVDKREVELDSQSFVKDREFIEKTLVSLGKEETGFLELTNEWNFWRDLPVRFKDLTLSISLLGKEGLGVYEFFVWLTREAIAKEMIAHKNCSNPKPEQRAVAEDECDVLGELIDQLVELTNSDLLEKAVGDQDIMGPIVNAFKIGIKAAEAGIHVIPRLEGTFKGFTPSDEYSDPLVERVIELVENGLSINKACDQVSGSETITASALEKRFLKNWYVYQVACLEKSGKTKQQVRPILSAERKHSDGFRFVKP